MTDQQKGNRHMGQEIFFWVLLTIAHVKINLMQLS